jgi:hypothetical protein
MGSTALDLNEMATGIGLFLVVCLLCLALLRSKRYLILFLWPILIYFCGPLITLVFADNPFLGKYVFPDAILSEVFIMFSYFGFFVLIDYFWDISSVIRSSFNGPSISRLAQSNVFLVLYVSIAALAAVLQIIMMQQFGSVFTGDYVASGYVEGQIAYWGFLSGLYELIFLCFVLYLLSGQVVRYRFLMIALYAITAALRLSGGTRLILIKELAVICILLFLRGRIKAFRLITVGMIIVIVGSVIGYFRNNGEIGDNAFGPFYGVAMESGLDALTFNAAYQVQASGYVEKHGDVLATIEFVAFSAVPSFLRLGFNQTDLDKLSPYGEGRADFDSESPVGGMSGFATICYLSSYPLASTLALVFGLAVLLKVGRQGAFKDIVVLVMTLDAIHFWRDPVDIAVKDVAQDVVCALVLLYLPAAYRALKFRAARSEVRGIAVP